MATAARLHLVLNKATSRRRDEYIEDLNFSSHAFDSMLATLKVNPLFQCITDGGLYRRSWSRGLVRADHRRRVLLGAHRSERTIRDVDLTPRGMSSPFDGAKDERSREMSSRRRAYFYPEVVAKSPGDRRGSPSKWREAAAGIGDKAGHGGHGPSI